MPARCRARRQVQRRRGRLPAPVAHGAASLAGAAHTPARCPASNGPGRRPTATSTSGRGQDRAAIPQQARGPVRRETYCPGPCWAEHHLAGAGVPAHIPAGDRHDARRQRASMAFTVIAGLRVRVSPRSADVSGPGLRIVAGGPAARSRSQPRTATAQRAPAATQAMRRALRPRAAQGDVAPEPAAAVKASQDHGQRRPPAAVPSVSCVSLRRPGAGPAEAGRAAAIEPATASTAAGPGGNTAARHVRNLSSQHQPGTLARPHAVDGPPSCRACSRAREGTAPSRRRQAEGRAPPALRRAAHDRHRPSRARPRQPAQPQQRRPGHGQDRPAPVSLTGQPPRSRARCQHEHAERRVRRRPANPGDEPHHHHHRQRLRRRRR